MAEGLIRASPLDAGWTALSGGDWEGARGFFEQSLVDEETPEALEGLGWAGHMLNEDGLTFDARQRAYRLYLDRGDKGSAARIAALLAADHLLFRGEPAVANGWLQRAHSLIDGLEPGVDHGWLAIHEGHIAVSLDEDTVKARRLAARAVELGRMFGAPELEMLGLGLEGRALVSEGELEDGMGRLDEATTVALAGEASLLYGVAWACCYTISACERVRDYERAAQWCARVGEFCGQHDIFLLNTCRALRERAQLAGPLGRGRAPAECGRRGASVVAASDGRRRTRAVGRATSAAGPTGRGGRALRP